jgi:hypothetical protein
MVTNDPRRAYDVLAFVARTTAARGMPSGRRPSQAERKPLHPEVINLGLDGPEPLPSGWHRPGVSRAHEHRIATSAGEGTASPYRVVQIARTTAPWRWGDGRLEQTFAAKPWCGKRLRFSALMRADARGPQSGAQLYVELRPEAAEDMIGRIPPAQAAMLEGPVRSPEWQRHMVEIDVAEAMHSITIGLAFSGNGSGWFGGLIVEAAIREHKATAEVSPSSS